MNPTGLQLTDVLWHNILANSMWILGICSYNIYIAIASYIARKLIIINFVQYSNAQVVKYKDELNILTDSCKRVSLCT